MPPSPKKPLQVSDNPLTFDRNSVYYTAVSYAIGVYQWFISNFRPPHETFDIGKTRNFVDQNSPP